MNKSVLIISDVKTTPIHNGGAEANNIEIIKILQEKNIQCDFLETTNFNNKVISDNSALNYDLYIVSNFFFISEESKKFLYDKKYIITEHDYKFVMRRNPCEYKDFKVPKEQLIHEEFYLKAAKVIVQSGFQEKIFNINLGLNNLYNFSGNLWDEKTIELIESLASEPKNGKACILGEDDYGVKGRDISIKFCDSFHLRYDLLPKTDPHSFLKNLSKYSSYIFFPQTPETLSRVSIEARLIGLSVVTNNNVAAVYEKFYDLPNKEMIEYIKNKRIEMFKIIDSLL